MLLNLLQITGLHLIFIHDNKKYLPESSKERRLFEPVFTHYNLTVLTPIPNNSTNSIKCRKSEANSSDNFCE